MKYGEQKRNIIMCRRNASPFRKARTGTYVLLLIGMLTMIVSTSFAWFSISSEPTVEDMSIYVNAPPGVSIATRYDAREEDEQQHALEVVANLLRVDADVIHSSIHNSQFIIHNYVAPKNGRKE